MICQHVSCKTVKIPLQNNKSIFLLFTFGRINQIIIFSLLMSEKRAIMMSSTLMSGNGCCMKIKSNTRKLKAAETKRKIYESAVLLMKEHGLDGFTVDDVVQLAGVSKGSFYVHFKSKYSLIAEHVTNVDNDYEAFFRTIPKDRKASEILFMMTDKIADILVNNVGFATMRTVYEVALKKADGTDAVLNQNRKINQIYQDIITQGVRQGEFTDQLDIESVSNQFVMGIRGLAFQWCAHYPDFDLKKEVMQLFTLMLKGISAS